MRYLCDEQHGQCLLSPADLNSLAAQTKATNATYLRETLRLLSVMAEPIERVT